jgi:hypothetical protein
LINPVGDGVMIQLLPNLSDVRDRFPTLVYQALIQGNGP